MRNIEDFKKAGDWLFWLQYLNISNNIQYLTISTNYFRQHNNSTRASIPYTRNLEILKIYKWIFLNVLNKKESWVLANYFLKKHLYLYPRTFFFKNFIEILQAVKHSKFITILIFQYYFKLKKHKNK